MGKIILCGLVVLLLVCVIPAAAYSVESNADNGDKPTMIVEYGKGKDAGLVKVTHIHYAKSADKARPGKTGTCYKLAGWKWSDSVTYTIAPDSDLTDAMIRAMGAWDSETSKVLFSTPGVGTYPWGGVSDGKNSVSFGDYSQDGVIAVTTTWYTVGRTKRAVESDILFDTDFTWGNADKDSTLMDLQNIATHEIGHTLGLSDLYTDACSAVTMYGYSTEGDTAKQTLEIPDITGLLKLYGV
jgi:hypothetical protein